ncbi:MAG: hypothetical protein C4527_24650 [Candidatus Omnitrophota bacterium]|jgi:hypothetical protein|nr:MAG: hypothetical protein C4527_24650 [Candidatus Omnitrophota bacterium]
MTYGSPSRILFIIAVILCITAFAVFTDFFHFRNQTIPLDPEFLPDRKLFNEQYAFQLAAPSDWYFLNRPNSLLDYPESAAQLTNEAKNAFCVVIPESISDPSVNLTIDDLRILVIKMIRNENPEVEFKEEMKLNTSWSDRLRIVYTSDLGAQTICWLIQIDLTGRLTYRTICWCAQKDFPQNHKAFLSVCDSLAPFRQENQL